MKYIILFVVLFLGFGAFDVSAQHRDTIVIHDTVYVERTKEPMQPKKNVIVESNSLIRIKPIGRYDRGIRNYRFVEKGKWLGGLTFSFVNYDSDESTMLYSIVGDLNANFSVKSVNPFVGYALKDNLVLGMKLGYHHLDAGLGNVELNLGTDYHFSFGNLKYSEDLYSAGAFMRSYIGLDENGIFGLFNETEFTYRHGTSVYSDGADADMKRTETTINEIRLGINPGVAVFITKNLCAEMSFGVAGLKFRSEKQRDQAGVEGKRHASGADFKINILNINIGLTLCL